MEANGSGSALVLTERGQVNHALFRALMLFHDQHKTMRNWAAAAGRQLGETMTTVNQPAAGE